MHFKKYKFCFILITLLACNNDAFVDIPFPNNDGQTTFYVFVSESEGCYGLAYGPAQPDEIVEKDDYLEKDWHITIKSGEMEFALLPFKETQYSLDTTLNGMENPHITFNRTDINELVSSSFELPEETSIMDASVTKILNQSKYKLDLSWSCGEQLDHGYVLVFRDQDSNVIHPAETASSSLNQQSIPLPTQLFSCNEAGLVMVSEDINSKIVVSYQPFRADDISYVEIQLYTFSPEYQDFLESLPPAGVIGGYSDPTAYREISNIDGAHGFACGFSVSKHVIEIE